MADKQYPTGTKPHGSGIRIRFTWNGQRHEPVWPRKPNKTNFAAASRLRAEIIAKAKYGTLTYRELAEYFPQYDKPEYITSETPLFSQLAQVYLDTVEVSKNTRHEYKKVLMKYWQPLYAQWPIDSINAAQLRIDVSKIEWSSAKTRNNALIPLRGVFELAVQDEIIERNPAEKIKNLKHQKIDIDPFTLEEADLITDYLYRRYKDAEVIYAAYFEFAFWTGMRTSEMLALTWSDIDWRRKTARISKAQSKGNANTQTKTAKTREVILNDRALHALSKAKLWTYLQGEQIFKSPRYRNEYWKTDKGPRIVFTAALKKLGVRHRRAYNTRHTYATICLMAGMNPAFVASQIGNSLPVLLSTYAKWIHGEASQQEMAKLSKLGQKWAGDETESCK